MEEAHHHLDAESHAGLHKDHQPPPISRFLDDLARLCAVGQELARGYDAMAADEARERDAEAWSKSLITDIADEPRPAWFLSRRRAAPRSGWSPSGRRSAAKSRKPASPWCPATTPPTLC